MKLEEKNQRLRQMVRSTMSGELSRRQYYENRRQVIASCVGAQTDQQMQASLHLPQSDDPTLPGLAALDGDTPTLPDNPVVKLRATQNYNPYFVWLGVALTVVVAAAFCL